MEKNNVVDIQGFACAMLVIKTKKALEPLQTGEVLEILSSDKGAINDLKAWSAATGHEFLRYVEEGDLLRIWIQKG